MQILLRYNEDPLNPKMQNHYPTLNPKLYNAKISSPFL
jgi:hypothetical protein